MSNVQPLSPEEPTLSVQLALEAAPPQPLTPTNSTLSATTPTQTATTYSAVKQLPENILTALTSQQAVNNNTISKTAKINSGIIDGAAGVTLQQLSVPGQYIKPGAGEFIQRLTKENPALPFNKSATNVLMTGQGGVGSPENLLRNTGAQLSAVKNSITTATTSLTNNGTLTGRENPTQVSGVIFAATAVGVGAVTAALKNPGSVAAAVGGVSNQIGNAITSGTFAAGLADKISNGVAGVATSISSIASGAVGALSSGISSFVSKTAGGIKALVGSVAGVMQNAFNVAEQSFGSLKADVPNSLGGLPETKDIQVSKTLSLVREHDIATEELAAAESLLGQAKKAYTFEESAETYSALREAEAKYAAAKQRVALSSNKVLQGAGAQGSQQTSIFGSISAQQVTALGAAAASGSINAPNTENTGVNAIPGGLGAFASQIGGAASNILDTIKNVAGTVSANIPGAMAALTNPKQLVGNLITNVKDRLSGVAAGIGASITNLGNIVNTTVANAGAAFNKLTGSAKAATTGLVSNIESTLAGLGNAPGQIKAATLATGTYASTQAVVSSTLNAALDPKVPPPTFEVVQPTFTPDQYQQAQLEAQQVISELVAQREFAAYQVDQLVEKFAQTRNVDLIDAIDAAKQELAVIDVQIIAAQENYDRLIST